MKNFEIKIAFSMEAEVVKNYNIELVRGDRFHLEEAMDIGFHKGELLEKVSLLFPLEQICELEKINCADILAQSPETIKRLENYCEEDSDA